MKKMNRLLATLCFLALGLAGIAYGEHPATNDMASAADLAQVIGRLDAPETARAARQTLIQFSGLYLYEGSWSWGTDTLRRTAAKAVQSRRNIDTVSQALDDDDADVRFWGVMGFETIHGRMQPWEALLPRLMRMATEDSDGRIRREAIRRLRSYQDGRAFLDTLQGTTQETEPDVLLMLMEYDSTRPEARAKFYERAIHFLTHNDEAMRLHWLCSIYLNVRNPSTAATWRIKADPALVEKLRIINERGSDREKDLAAKILDSLMRTNDGIHQAGAECRPTWRDPGPLTCALTYAYV